MSEESRAILVRIPAQMYNDIKEFVEQNRYRNAADFLYVSAHEHLLKERELARFEFEKCKKVEVQV